MIRSYRNATTAAVAAGKTVKGFPADLAKRAINKLTILEYATSLEDLRSPPGNRLEALRGDRKGQHSIRLNDQFRICFRWVDGHAEDVEITDYH